MFYDHLCAGMSECGFKPCDSDPCLFIHQTDPVMVLAYVDDCIYMGSDKDLINKHIANLKDKGYTLTTEEDGDMFGFLGIDVKQSGTSIELTQKGLIQKAINYVGLADGNSKPTPAAANPLGADKHGEPFHEDWNYAAAIGMLLYVSSNTQPDIQFAVHQCARFTHNPKKSHGEAVKRICQYLLGTKEWGILFTPNLAEGLNCYVDADFAGLWGYEDEQDPVCVKSRTGFTLTLFGCPIIWASKLQTEITLSSTAAEYVAFSMAMRELLPMCVLLQELGAKMNLEFAQPSLVRSTVFEDNQGCLALVNVPRMSPRNKYLALKYHFFCNEIGPDKGIIAKWIPTTEQQVAILMKGLQGQDFSNIWKLLMGW